MFNPSTGTYPMFINVEVLNGLPIEIYAEGDHWHVVAIAGRKVNRRHAGWLYARIESNSAEYAALWAQIEAITGE